MLNHFQVHYWHTLWHLYWLREDRMMKMFQTCDCRSHFHKRKLGWWLSHSCYQSWHQSRWWYRRLQNHQFHQIWQLNSNKIIIDVLCWLYIHLWKKYSVLLTTGGQHTLVTIIVNILCHPISSMETSRKMSNVNNKHLACIKLRSTLY